MLFVAEPWLSVESFSAVVPLEAVSLECGAGESVLGTGVRTEADGRGEGKEDTGAVDMTEEDRGLDIRR